MKLLITFFLLIQSLYGQIVFQQCSSAEIQLIEDSMLTFYSEQLVQAGLFESPQLAKEAAILEWTEERQNSNKEFFYCRLSKQSQGPCGYLVYSIERQIAHLDAIYLEEAYRGQGIGTRILQDLELLLREKKIESIQLYVFAHNQKAIDLYKKRGYAIETSYSVDNALIGHHMKKDLNFSGS